MTIQGHPPFFLKPQPRFVTLRGGDYLFQPSMTACGTWPRHEARAAAIIAVSGAMFSDVALDVDGGRASRLDRLARRALVARVYDVTTRRTHELQRIQGLRGRWSWRTSTSRRQAPRWRAYAISRTATKAWRVRVFRRHGRGRVVTGDPRSRHQALGRRPPVRCGRRRPGLAGVDRGPAAAGAAGRARRARTARSSRGARSPAKRSSRSSRSRRTARATVGFRLGRDDATVHVAQRPATGGWSVRRVDAGGGPELAMDGAGRALLAWSPWSPDDSTLRLATGPEFAPTPFVSEGNTSLAALEAGSRGDVLAAWTLGAGRFGDPVPTGWGGPAIPPPRRRAAAGRAVLGPGAARPRRALSPCWPRWAPTAQARSPTSQARGDGFARSCACCGPTAAGCAPATLTGGVAGLMPAGSRRLHARDEAP